MEVMKRYIICPVCHDSGGGGILTRLIVRDTATVFYACDQCESAWTEGTEISAASYEVITGILLKSGIPLERHRGAVKEWFNDRAFLWKGDALRDWLYQVFQRAPRTSSGDRDYPYCYLYRAGTTVGVNGEECVELVLNRGETYILTASPAPCL